jgi:8-oxo-dGTP pyrophosphatase MutT (NUDIX family)
MKIQDLFENDRDHADALEKTGFWGSAGAGCIMLASQTGRILLAHRSEYVEQPGTWGGWGGAIDAGMTPEESVRKEVSEEAGYHEPFMLVPLYRFESGSFKYFNYLAIVEHEFAPELNWETQGYQWCEWGKWPHPLHFGLEKLFADQASVDKIQQAIEQTRAAREETDESVGAVGGARELPSYMAPMVTAMQTAQNEGTAWGKENPTAMRKEVEAACPYQKSHMSLVNIWINAALKAQNDPLQFKGRGIKV